MKRVQRILALILVYVLLSSSLSGVFAFAVEVTPEHPFVVAARESGSKAYDSSLYENKSDITVSGDKENDNGELGEVPKEEEDEDGGPVIVIPPAWKPADNRPRVTEVYSINATLGQCYYVPTKDEIPNLREYIQQDGRFINAYMGYYDLNIEKRRGENNGKPAGIPVDETPIAKGSESEFNIQPNEPNKPLFSQSRALEILGYDLLLENESYTIGSDGAGVYQAETVQDINSVKFETAVMDIYKSLGIERYNVKLFYEQYAEMTLQNTPAAIGLPSYVTELDTSKGKTKVFVTRTNPYMYLSKAEKDLNISTSSFPARGISASEFFLLLTRMMQFYGEPVMSDKEMNQLLQVYGASIPLHYSPSEQQAFLYLKSRGVLNVECDWNEPLKLSDMLDVLMCVKDVNSRTDYKKIQITTTIPEDLAEAGYYARDAVVDVDNPDLAFRTDYDYNNIVAYDYLVKYKVDSEKQEDGIFRDLAGNVVMNPFVPSNINSATYKPYLDSFFIGIEEINGEKYFHFVVPTGYNLTDNNTVVINTDDDNDRPRIWELEKGGGIYEYSSTDADTSTAKFTRTTFEGRVEFDGYADTARKVTPEVVTVGTVLSNVVGAVLSPFVQTASATSFSDFQFSPTWYNGVRKTVTIPNKQALRPEFLLSLEHDSRYYITPNTGPSVLNIKLPLGMSEAQFRSIVQMNTIGTTISANKPAGPVNTNPGSGGGTTATPAPSSGVGSSAVTAPIKSVANLDGALLVDYKELVAAGLLTQQSSLSYAVPVPMGDVLTLYSNYGAVRLNDVAHEICVGSIIYKVEDNDRLYKYTEENGGTLLIDYRAVLGWSYNALKITPVGSGKNATVSVETIKSGKRDNPLDTAFIYSPTDLAGPGGYFPTAFTRKEGNVNQFVLASTYPLSNWFIHVGRAVNGLTNDYLFVFYPKSAYNDHPTDISKMDTFKDAKSRMASITGYSVTNESIVVQAIPLNHEGLRGNKTPGQIAYVDEVGYVYNVPTMGTDYKDGADLINKYLKGEYALPLVNVTDPGSGMSTMYRTINANKWSGIPWGGIPSSSTHYYPIDKILRPASSAAAQAVKEIQAPGNPHNREVIGAPTAVAAQLMATNSPMTKLKTVPADSSSIFFYGSKEVSVVGGVGDVRTISFDKGLWDAQGVSPDADVVVAAEFGLSKRVYVILNETLDVVKTTPTNEEITKYDISSGDNDKFMNFKDVTLRGWLNFIDNGSSVVIYFALKILPMLGILLVTLLLGLAFLSDVKIVQMLCDKYIDPVRLLTFGHMTIHELDIKTSIWSIILAYTLFALVLDGNLLRILEWILKAYSDIVHIIKVT